MIDEPVAPIIPLTPRKGHSPKPKAMTQEGRRAKVQAYLAAGVRNQSELARFIGVHRNTVAADLSWLRDQDKDRITQGDAHQILGETDRVLQDIEQRARDTCATTKDPKVRESLMKLERDTRVQRIELLFKTGAIPRLKDTDEFLVAQEFRSMSSEQLKQRARDLAVKLRMSLREGGEAPGFRGAAASSRYRATAAKLGEGEELDEISLEPLPPEEDVGVDPEVQQGFGTAVESPGD